MDNVTHTLIGIAAGEAVALHRKKPRTPLWIASGLANNLPDLDVILTSFVFKGEYSYILHHRGHTHTLLLAPLLTGILLLCLYPFWRKRENFPWREVLFLSFLGPFLHLFADYWNSYGVHPFWPFSNNWIYGDMVFIVEPWLWVSMLPMIFFACATRIGKGICLFLLAFIVGLSWYHEAVSWPSSLALSLGLAVLFFVKFRLPTAGKRVVLSLFLVCTILAGLGGISQGLKKRYQGEGSEFLVQPFPANPFCWTAMEAMLSPDGYYARTMVLAPFPGIVKAENCPRLYSGPTTAPLTPSLTPPSPDRRIDGNFVGSAEKFRELKQDCRVNAALRFIRIPYWKEVEGGLIFGDMRFDRNEGLGLGEFFLADGDDQCPTNVPGWAGPFHPDRDT